jgi:hypothetical protein
MLKIMKKFLKKLVNKYNVISENKFNQNRSDRFGYKKSQENKYFPKGEGYWLAVAADIKATAQVDEENFFRDPAVILHLASENPTLGYRILEKIKSHPLGRQVLSKCGTPAWGAPFLLRKYPFLSPTTASHIANILSIYDSFGKNISSIIDFGGGYGGFAQCVAKLDKNIDIEIIDMPEMLYVQSRYLECTTSSYNCEFNNDIDQLISDRYEIFNASFSFSEVSVNDRSRIEDFIINKLMGVHIIFQSSFNGVDNIKYMNEFKIRLEQHDWRVTIEQYDWYGWSDAFVLTGLSKKVNSEVAE